MKAKLEARIRALEAEAVEREGAYAIRLQMLEKAEATLAAWQHRWGGYDSQTMYPLVRATGRESGNGEGEGRSPEARVLTSSPSAEGRVAVAAAKPAALTGRLSEVCIASDRFHQVIEVLIDFEGYGATDAPRQVRLCGECGLWDTYIQEEHGGPDPYPPNPYGPGGARRRL